MKKDVGGVADKGVDQMLTDTTQSDTAQPDAAQPDTSQPDQAWPEASAGDAQPVGDGGNFAAMCGVLIKTCGSSLTWPQYIKPYTTASCVSVVNCVDKLYTGACNTKFQEMVKCIATITASTQCDTKCLTEITYLNTNCTCPSSCGVACP